MLYRLGRVLSWIAFAIAGLLALLGVMTLKGTSPEAAVFLFVPAGLVGLAGLAIQYIFCGD